MVEFRRRPSPMLAFLYTGQPKDQWPNWLVNYSTYNAIQGETNIVELLGTLVIPTASTTVKVGPNNWIVLERYEEKNGKFIGDLEVYSKDGFYDMFEPIES